MIRTLSTVILLNIALNFHVGNCADDRNGLINEERRQILVKNIIHKLTNLSLFSFYNTSLENRYLVMENIRNKLKSVSKFAGPRRDKYVELIMDGIKSNVASKRVSDIESSINENAIDVNGNIHKHTDKSNALRARVHSHTKLDDLINSIQMEDATAVTGEETCDCSCVEGKLCSKIASLSQFTCHKDQKEIPLMKLCDGKYNCKDKSDEEQCRIHANKKLADANQIIEEIKTILPKRCLEVQSIKDKVIMKTHEGVFANVLKKQVQYLDLVTPIKIQKLMAKPMEEVKEISIIVSSVGAALEGALCIRRKIYKNVSNRRSGASIDEDIVFKEERSWVPPLCTCVNQFCAQKNCTPACSNTCWQRYSLGQWVCNAISGAPSVSLDFLCDGKVDCFDESDENECTSGASTDKFEATQMFNSILEVLSTKTASAEFHHLLNKFINLQESVRSLQAQTMVEESNAPAVKTWRDDVIAGIRSIYEGMLVKTHNINEIDAGYNFLMSVNHKLVDAMKRSKTGSERIVSNDCHCVRDKCMLAKCSKVCARTCAVRTRLTEYSCRNASSLIPIQNICNDKKECPEGDDEESCRNDVCRNHHLVVLRNKIENYKDNSWGNMFSEILETWKTKTIGAIRVVEKMDRIYRSGFQKLVFETLHDLVHTYAGLPKLTRRSTNSTLDPFLDLSRLLQDTLRDCTN